MSRPMLSVHVSVFNLEKYIKQCLDSILQQSFEDFELILVDNGSTDGSIAICEEYAKKDARIKYTKFPLPTVIGRPIGYALQHFEGQYFMSVDGDDYLCEHALQNIADAIKKSHADLIMGSFLCDIEEGMTNFKDADFDASRINGVLYDHALEYITTLPNFHTFQWRFIVERELAMRVGMRKSSIYSRYRDGMTVTAYLTEAHSIFYVKEPFYVYRRRGNSLSTKVEYGKQALDFFKAFAGILDAFQKEIREQNSYKRTYILHMLEARFEMFRNLYLNMEEAEIEELIAVIDQYRSVFDGIEQMSEHYREFYQCFADGKDTKEALCEYRIKEELVQNAQIRECKGKRIYVFPTGLCGENIAQILRNNGIEVVAFLDNDVMREHKVFGGVVCRLPSYVQETKDKDEYRVLIATVYRKNVESMKSQMLSYGVPVEKIIVR